MGLVSLTLYGVGDMLGAGIYGLVGRAAGLMGNLVWLGFLVAMIAALLTGLSYACIGSRYPQAAGAAAVVQRAYRRPLLTWTIGLAIAGSGLTSMATGSRVIAGYLQKLGLNLPTSLIAIVFLVLVAGVVFRGIRESSWMNAICTSVELSGLLLVIAVGIPYWGSVDYTLPPPTISTSTQLIGLSLQGAVLTFFAFIGFEDMLNVAEEVKDPARTLPRALVMALIIATVLYMAVAITAVSVLPPEKLAASSAALVDVVAVAAPWFPTQIFTGIGLFAVANTALLNFIMGSRLLYGLAQQGLMPPVLGTVHPSRRTPHVAIVVLLAVVIVLVLSGTIDQLAAATSLLLLTAFVVVNLGLVLLQGRPEEPRGSFEVPRFVPALGALVCLALIATRVLDPSADPRAPIIAGVFLVICASLYAVRQRGLS